MSVTLSCISFLKSGPVSDYGIETETGIGIETGREIVAEIALMTDSESAFEYENLTGILNANPQSLNVTVNRNLILNGRI